MVRRAADGSAALVVIHVFAAGPERARVEIPLGGRWSIDGLLAADALDVRVIAELLLVSGLTDSDGTVIRLSPGPRPLGLER